LCHRKVKEVFVYSPIRTSFYILKVRRLAATIVPRAVDIAMPIHGGTLIVSVRIGMPLPNASGSVAACTIS
jgi:hypothetical protein